ncbi:hypothetical protein N7509_009956 [Penicillium cosmopolitanum]|uniref:medium-chain acyl-CoA ligase n=1 Tax=Penicillium cosmopolitanum TaxID=1131564 RepID=A0A9W9VQM4_9EURO|nr:uncharacterized protein N7509_009956 [Penicillium cosmopolitanum]KAJ5387415.1 hypothetical protein N7509_009956 [Penicillium cosmopolitanum]
MAPLTHIPLQRPDHFNFATDVVDTWAAKSPSLEAMLWVSHDKATQKSLTYQHFSQQSQRIALLLEQLGARPGDVMLMVLPRAPAWWEVATAGLRSGILIAPATTLLTAKDIEYRSQRSKATVFVGDATSVRKIQQVRHKCPSLRVIIQTEGQPEAGVTGLYKAIEQIETTARHFRSTEDAHLLTGKYWLNLSPGKLCWNYTEQGWGKAAYSYFGAWNCGASLFVWDDRGPFNATTILEHLHNFPIATLCAPPLAWRQLVQQQCQQYYRKNAPRALAQCNSAGEPLDSTVIDQWRSLSGLTICEGYGQTETTLMCGNYGGFEVRPGSMGKPIPGVPLYVINPAGQETPANEEGELALLVADGDSPSNFFGIFDGYVHDNGEATRNERISTLHGKIRKWYLTGDKAKRDKDGYLWFVGRADDVINSSGYRIGPFEVESTLKQHPAVAECAVISSPDMVRGEVVKAFIVLTSKYAKAPRDQLTKELQIFCKTNSAPYKYPRKVAFVNQESLPRTTSGKIKRAELRKLEWQNAKSENLPKL